MVEKNLEVLKKPINDPKTTKRAIRNPKINSRPDCRIYNFLRNKVYSSN